MVGGKRQCGEEPKMLDLALVTANFGGIDELKPLPEGAEFDRFYYTDGDTLARATLEAVATWTRVIVPEYPRAGLGPRLRSRYFKCQIYRLPEIQPYRWLAWADSKFLFHDMSFLGECIEQLRRLPTHSRAMMVPHWKRKTVRQEHDYIIDQMENGSEYLRTRYLGEGLTEQVRFYERNGWNVEAKLWACGLWLVENNSDIRDCWNTWWDHTLCFSIMDQISLPVVLDRHGIRPQEFPFNPAVNAYFERVAHRVNM
jgi:hypothetical protein